MEKKIKVKVLFKEKVQTDKKSSLFKMFDCEYFTFDMLLQYLYNRREDERIYNYLVMKLYEKKTSEIGFYLP